jgi:helicase
MPEGDPSVTSGVLRQVLGRGVAFHNSELSREERLVLEDAFRRRELRVLVATSTLAMGVNTPASTVIVVETAWWNGTPYPVAEHRNMVGRAGRLGITERGRSLIVARDPRTEHLAWGQYVTGSPEDLRSRFLDTDPRALILRALATVAGPGMAGQMSEDELIEFLENSWGVFQRRAVQGEWAWDAEELRARLAELEQLEMVERDEAGNLGLLPLGRFAGEAGVAVETIVRLARVARNAPGLADGVSALALVQMAAELDEVYMPVNTRGWRKEASSWLQELARIGIA